MNEFLYSLEAKIESEKKDHDSYWELAGKAAHHEHYDYAAILRDIAREEEQHRNHLIKIIAEIKKCENK